MIWNRTSWCLALEDRGLLRHFASGTDIRDLQTKLEGEGVTFATKIDAGPEGPASFILLDPDGNPVLIDQHR